jgi:hypothetical protein
MSERHLLAGLLLLTAASAFAGCNFGFYQGQDRPDDQGVEGPPPPADFHCERGTRHKEDTDHDGKPDRVVHVLGNGDVLCSTEDRNGDGKIDTWNLHENGHIVEQATDVDFDGKLDQRARGPNADGTWKLLSPFAAVPPLADGGGRRP